MTDLTLDTAHWQTRLEALAERFGVPGAQLGVLRAAVGVDDSSADEIDILTHGVTRTETGQPVTDATVFQIGSITKVWTATLAMQLVDEGALDLDTRVAEVLPELTLKDKATREAMTVRHLLTHTNGIDGDVFVDTGRGDDALERYAECLHAVDQAHPLGETWSYSNSGYILLGRVIERVTGGTWDAAIRERIVARLGLSRTSTLPEEALLHDTALGHVVGLPHPVPAPVWAMPRSVGPAGLVNATARDLLAFVQAHLHGGLGAAGERLLTAESTTAMAAHQVDLPDPHSLGDSWGLGWIRFDWNGTRLLGHDGATVGQSAFLRVLPEAGLAVTLLTNGGQAQDLFETLFRELFADVAALEATASFGPPEEPIDGPLGDWSGSYRGAALQLDAFMDGPHPRLRITMLGALAQLDPEPVQEYDLVVVSVEPERSVYAIRFRGGEAWSPVTFYRIASGRAYAHFGARALPAVED
ncbi:serine hydrolase [Demequina sp. NBRC 110057]|uniref:serine hydrolase domain-containing protein n=1 Tax=Demequina sp. NBRC 110057 TaxID=1570346 RepID=UPI00190EDE1A|nr:serine hydrolase domain-containing protein [Demequina sp. NBRC 110057]